MVFQCGNGANWILNWIEISANCNLCPGNKRLLKLLVLHLHGWSGSGHQQHRREGTFHPLKGLSAACYIYKDPRNCTAHVIWISLLHTWIIDRNCLTQHYDLFGSCDEAALQRLWFISGPCLLNLCIIFYYALALCVHFDLYGNVLWWAAWVSDLLKGTIIIHRTQ